jgi:hypothetical protein
MMCCYPAPFRLGPSSATREMCDSSEGAVSRDLGDLTARSHLARTIAITHIGASVAIEHGASCAPVSTSFSRLADASLATRVAGVATQLYKARTDLVTK